MLESGNNYLTNNVTGSCAFCVASLWLFFLLSSLFFLLSFFSLLFSFSFPFSFLSFFLSFSSPSSLSFSFFFFFFFSFLSLFFLFIIPPLLNLASQRHETEYQSWDHCRICAVRSGAEGCIELGQDCAVWSDCYRRFCCCYRSNINRDCCCAAMQAPAQKNFLRSTCPGKSLDESLCAALFGPTLGAGARRSPPLFEIKLQSKSTRNRYPNIHTPSFAAGCQRQATQRRQAIQARLHTDSAMQDDVLPA